MLLMGVVLFYGMVMFFENNLIFIPQRYPVGNFHISEDPKANPRPQDVWFKAADGTRLHAWYFETPRVADEPEPPVILLCHGNAGNLSGRYVRAAMLMSAPADVFVFDYRGYGRSDGKPHEAGVYLDVEAAWRELTEQRAIAPDRIVIYGVSLGGVMAIHLASQVPAAGLVVESTFTSVADMARVTMPFIPTFLIRTKMNSAAKIQQATMPKLHIHSPLDEVVPFQLGQKLYECAPDPKRFYQVDGSGHNDTRETGGAALLAQIHDFVRQAVP
jgi:fermentation-respiration switch protein FrsA (DUF1100 family)